MEILKFFHHEENNPYPDLDPKIVKDAVEYLRRLEGGTYHSVNISSEEAKVLRQEVESGKMEPNIVYAHALNLRDNLPDSEIE